LIELLTVITIIGILAGILIPTVSTVRYTARQSKSLSQLRSVGQATWLYAGDNKQNFPTLWTNGVAPLWTHKLYSYLEPYATGSGYWCSPTLLDPLLEGEKHNKDYGDYGASNLIFMEANALSSNAVKNPAHVAMVMTARSGNKVSYQVVAQGFINNPARTDNMPHARAKGKVLAVMVDGHVQAIAESVFIEQRAAFLKPDL
ncbi:MAG: type II secretion system protein, partial [Opitutaceae bacterium]|nr:type II secretion system protein [Opitutaceae bacterium]